MVGIIGVDFPSGGFSAPDVIQVDTGSKKVTVKVEAIADSSGTFYVTAYGVAR